MRLAKDAVRLVRRAIDEGITFLDNSWDYAKGKAEQRVGKAVKESRARDRVVVMTKIDGRTKKEASRQIEESLKRLDVDRIDILQHHEVIRLEDPDRIFAEDGAHEALVEAQQSGKVRFVGFTGHKDPAVHLRMLEIARSRGIRLDTVQMPLNVMDAHFRSFEKDVLPVLVREGIGVLGMKSMAEGHALKSGVVTAPECLRYALSLPTSVVITGIDSNELLDQAIKAAREFTPLTDEERRELLARTAPPAATGKWEPFKTTNQYDATAQNPAWLG
jgi:aryl-alcohol dehydrogenase-like predicted oxidoreductase